MSSSHHVPSSDPAAGAGLYPNVPYSQSSVSPLPARQQPITYNNQWQYQSGGSGAAAAAPNTWPVSSTAQAQAPYFPVEYKNSSAFNQHAFNDSFRNNSNAAVNDSSYPGATIQPSNLNAASAVQAPQSQARALPPTGQPQLSNLAGAVASKSSQNGYLALPKGTQSGQFQILSGDDLQPICPVRQMSAFLDVAVEPFDIPITRATIPAYTARKSRNEIKALLRSNTNLKAKVNKKNSRRVGTSVSKEVRLDASGQLTSVSRRGSHSTSEGSDYSSEDESSDGEPPDEERPGPAQRPEQSVKRGILWDTIQATWCPRNRPATPDEIRNGLKNFWSLVQSIRGRWKSDAEAVKAAEEGKKLSELPMLKSRVTEQRQFFQIVMKAAIKHGHRDILKHCGENLQMMNVLAVALQDRAKEADYNGELGRSILEMLKLCTTLTEGALDSSKVGRVIPRFAAKGDGEIKSLVKAIQENASAASKKKKESTTKPSSASSSEANAKSANVAGVKRSSGSEGQNGSPAKKIVAIPKKPPVKPPVTADAGPKAAPSSTAAPATAKTKPANVSASASFFDSLKSASKKPGTSNAAREAAKKTTAAAPTVPVKKPAVNAAQPLSSAPAFDFGATLAGLKKPKEPEPSQTEKKPPSETEEQRTKRLRKEARRRLSVRFKPDAELEQVRIFHHDPDEELGHNSSQMRDATDLGSEGRMFKMKAQAGMDNDSDEEEEDTATARFNAPYPHLTDVDFSSLPEDAIKFSFKPMGHLDVDSPDTQRQLQHESENLIVVYSSRADIPTTPGEPTQPQAESDHKPPLPFGSMDAIPKSVAFVDVTARIEKALQAATQPAVPVAPLLSADLQNLLASLGAGQQQPAPTSSTPMTNLDWIQNTFSGQPQQNPTAYTPAPAPALSFNMFGSQQAPPPAAPAPSIDLAAILSAVQQAHPQAVAPAQPQPQSQPDWMNPTAYPPPPAPVVPAFGAPMPTYDNRNHKRSRSQDEDYDSKRQKRDQQPKVGWTNGEPPKYVLPCKFWKEGKCTKGDSCTFRHDDD